MQALGEAFIVLANTYNPYRLIQRIKKCHLVNVSPGGVVVVVVDRSPRPYKLCY